MPFSKADLRLIYGHLASLLPPGARPLSADQCVAVNGLLEKTREEIASCSAQVERGRMVFSWRIPAASAPTMNEWGFWKPWRRARARRELEDMLHAILAATPSATLVGQKMRWVRVTRFTCQPKNVDDAAVDAIGGKMPVDTLVRLGVLAGDAPTLLRREAKVLPTARGNTHVLVEVFEVGIEGVAEEGPKDGRVETVERQRGMFTQHLMGGGA